MTINYKVFAAGDTLSANDLLTYIENQAVIQVDNEAELTTLNTTYPSVRVAFAQDTDKMYVNNDGVWEAVVSGASPSLTNLTLTGNLTVQGTTTTIDSATIAVKDKFIFEGATADAHETTLQVAEPTADRTITLPDATGTVALTSGLYALPSQTGNSGKYLKTDGTNETWSIDATSDLVTTAGDIVYGTAADTMTRLGIGTANQVLRVNSGATAPEWATPASGGGMTLINETVATASTGITFSSLGSYKQLLLMWSHLNYSANGVIGLRFNNNSGSVYELSTIIAQDGTGAADTRTTTYVEPGWSLFGQSVTSTTTANRSFGYILIDNYTSTTRYKSFNGRSSWRDNQYSNTISVDFVGSFLDSATAITTLDIYQHTSTPTFTNQTGGSFRLYGLS